MDQNIGLWIDELQYVWDDKQNSRLYIIPKSSFVVDSDNRVARISKDRELYLFPMPQTCERNLARVYSGPLNMKEIYKKYGEGSLRIQGQKASVLKKPKTTDTFWFGQYTRTAIPHIFYGKDPKAVKSPIVNIKTKETFDNIWELQRKKRLTKLQAIETHRSMINRKGDYKYFWQTFQDKKAMELGRQISFVSFAFFLL
ncbi:conserved hypothetical protein [Lausannevirus]|uniref:Uncharacterized protein n=1 Tax=Lausannevirus TaxID=999883 RepID=F2WLW2_9VIRU|nr:hypothetical protein LAU_0385 [Lausannevirus]AEA07235.1 conserved hypothetical protein [Lausannevirus]